MRTTLIFGGSGKVARHLTSQLITKEGHQVHSIIRNPDQQEEIKQLGATPVVQSIEETSVAEFAATIKSVKPDYIVWTAGAGGGNAQRTGAVDRDGAIKSMDAASEAGVKRYIIVSALDLRDRDNKPEPSWYDEASRTTSKRLWGAIEPYMKAKFTADKSLKVDNDRRKLDYTIVRPGGLNQDPGVGTVSAGKVSMKLSVSREDIASVIVECIKNDGTIGLAFDVAGGNVPISDAINDVAANRVDTFEGYY